jgi:hypothetical protein
MVSNKILNTMRGTNIAIMRKLLENPGAVGMEYTDKFGNVYLGWLKMEYAAHDALDKGEIDKAKYIANACKNSAEGGMCSVRDVMVEPYVMAMNAKNNVWTDLTYRSYKCIQDYGMVEISMD